MIGKVYLVGAGPGDPGLISVKALNILKKADVVIYDNLINKRLLRYVKQNCEVFFAGKTIGRQVIDQDAINKLMVKKAKENKLVIRLKCGDPFIFGRDGEEALYLAKKKIPFEVIPGITSGIAAAAYAGIPLTHRDFNSTLTFVTAHQSALKKESWINWQELVSDYQNLVFYMGVENLSQIIKKLLQYKKPPNTPVAIIRNGTFPSQKTIVGKLSNIISLAEKNKIEPPCIIIVGEIIKLRKKINWYETKPLFNKRIIITRAQEQSEKLVELLENLGAQAIELPTIEVLPLKNYQKLDEAIKNIQTFDYLLFTSVNGAKYFLERFLFVNKDIRNLYNIKIITIGEVTKEFVESYNIKVDFCPTEFTSEVLLKELKAIENLANKKILYPSSNLLNKQLITNLTKDKAIVKPIVTYKIKTGLHNKNKEVIKDISNQKNDYIIFTSPSTVEGFLKLGLASELKEIKIVSIGPTTSSALRRSGFSPYIEAKTHTAEGIVEAILNSLK